MPVSNLEWQAYDEDAYESSLDERSADNDAVEGPVIPPFFSTALSGMLDEATALSTGLRAVLLETMSTVEIITGALDSVDLSEVDASTMFWEPGWTAKKYDICHSVQELTSELSSIVIQLEDYRGRVKYGASLSIALSAMDVQKLFDKSNKNPLSRLRKGFEDKMDL